MIRWIVAGLGNPGKQYQNTRHNVGFVVAERLAQLLVSGSWCMDKKFNAEVNQGGEILLIKPQTFMNKSGMAVSAVMRFYKVPLDHLILVHDDLDIPLGYVKMGFSKGPKVHNGVESVDTQVGSKDYWRVRVGIDNRTAEDRVRFSPTDYVLKQLDQNESKLLDKAYDEALLRVKEIIKQNATTTLE